MKQIIFFFALLFSVASFGQGTVKYSAGISYGVGAPTYTPNGNVSKKYVNLTTLRSYTYSGALWVLDGRGIDFVSGCAAPAYTPGLGQSNIAINNCTLLQNGQGPELYVFDGTSWVFINEKSTAPTYTDGAGINIAGTVITNTAPDQVVSIAGAGINAITGTYPNFTVTGTEVDGSTTNELQTLSVAGSNLSISGGNTVTLPTPSSTLDALTDVTITSPANNQILQYNSAGSRWVNAALAAITGIGASGKAAYWTSSSEISYSDNFRYNSDHKQLQIGNFTRGSGVVSTQSIITDGEIRAAGGYGLRSPVVGDNTKIGMYYESGYLKLYLANSPLLELQGTGATQLPSVSFTRYINPSSGTTHFGLIQANVVTQASGSYSGTISYIRDITSVNNSNPSGTGNFTSFAMQPSLSGYGHHRGVYFAPITAGSGNVIAIENTIGNNYLNSLSGSTGIGTSSINTAAKIDVTSTTSGVLFPRMTATQRDAIASPPDGLVVYNTTAAKLQVRAASAWVDLH